MAAETMVLVCTEALPYCLRPAAFTLGLLEGLWVQLLSITSFLCYFSIPFFHKRSAGRSFASQ